MHPDLRARIRPVDAEALQVATSMHGDAVRGWWSCVSGPGPVHLETEPRLDSVDAGLARADALCDEGVGGVVVSAWSPVPDDLRAMVGLLCGKDATLLTPEAATDLQWMSNCAAIREAQARLRGRLADALTVVDNHTAGLVGLLVGLAARATPCVFVGTVAHGAAVVAQRQSIAAAGWWRSGYCSTDPLDAVACERLQLEPWWTGRTAVDIDVVESLIVGTISSLRSSP